MLTPDKIDCKAMEFSDEEVQTMGEILLKAKEIEADRQLLALVQKSLKNKVKAIKSTDDLRDRANKKDLED